MDQLGESCVSPSTVGSPPEPPREPPFPAMPPGSSCRFSAPLSHHERASPRLRLFYSPFTIPRRTSVFSFSPECLPDMANPIL